MIYIISSFRHGPMTSILCLQDKPAWRCATPAQRRREQGREHANEDGERPFFFPERPSGTPIRVPITCGSIPPISISWIRRSTTPTAGLQSLSRDLAPRYRAVPEGVLRCYQPGSVEERRFHYTSATSSPLSGRSDVLRIIHQDVGENTMGCRTGLAAIHRGLLQEIRATAFGQIVTTNINASTYRVWGTPTRRPG